MKFRNKYNEIASVYEEFIPDFWGTKHNFLDQFFIGNHEKKTLLDLGCGTGILLKYYEEYINLYTGVDHSIEMLKKASNTYTKKTFINEDITKFIRKDYKFDIIISLYDTINHLLHKNLWEKLFFNVSEMLHDEGVFIFDVCTKNDLEKNWPSHINIIDNQNYMIISNGEFDQISKVSKIHHNYFVKKNDTYTRKYDCIEHISFEIADIINMLRNVNINNIEVFDLDTKKEVTKRTTVAVFICKRI
jgi:SAM-dependent methyltransferase